MTATSTTVKPRSLSPLHLAATGAAVLVFLFVVLWAGAAFGALASLRVLFAPYGEGSPWTLAIGIASALGLGALMGLAVAIFYNMFRFLGAVQSVERG